MKNKDSHSLKIKKITFLLIDFDEVLKENLGSLVKIHIYNEIRTLKKIQKVLNSEIRRIEESEPYRL